MLELLEQVIAPFKEVPEMFRGFFHAQKSRPQPLPQTQGQPDKPDRIELLFSAGWMDVVKNALIGPIGIFGSLILAAILGYGNGYMFSGFANINFTDPLSVAIYGGGYIMEFIGVALLYRASQARQDREYGQFVFTFLFGLVLMSVSWLGQFLLLEHGYMIGPQLFPDAAIESMPMVGGVITGLGLHGHDAVYFIRAAVFHLGELACVFLIPIKKPDISKTVSIYLEKSIAQIQIESAQQMQDMMGQTNAMAKTMLAQISAQALSAAQQMLLPAQAPVIVEEERQATVAPPQPQKPPIPITKHRAQAAQQPPAEPVVKKTAPQPARVKPVQKEEVPQVTGEPQQEIAPSFTTISHEAQKLLDKHKWQASDADTFAIRGKEEKDDARRYQQLTGSLPPGFTEEDLR